MLMKHKRKKSKISCFLMTEVFSLLILVEWSQRSSEEREPEQRNRNLIDKVLLLSSPRYEIEYQNSNSTTTPLGIRLGYCIATNTIYKIISS